MQHAVANTDSTGRRARGQRSHLAGHAAEDQVAQRYVAAGATLLHRCWRGRGGEIDLIFRRGEEIWFVEVKSSRTHARAATHLRPAQMARLAAAAEEFLGTCPAGSLTPTRLDVALVDGSGRIEILENALAGV